LRDALAKCGKAAILDNSPVRQSGGPEISEVGKPFAWTDVDGHGITDADFVHGNAAAEQCILVGPLDIEFLDAAFRLGNFERDLRMRVPGFENMGS
jgi:hypothetical protein